MFKEIFFKSCEILLYLLNSYECNTNSFIKHLKYTIFNLTRIVFRLGQVFLMLILSWAYDLPL